MDNPIEWYQEKYCLNCKNKPCQKMGSGTYRTDWNAKLFCIMSSNIMLNLDRQELKKMKK